MKPFYIAIDGIDGCGKTTQVKNVAEYLKNLNIPVYITKEPGGTEVGSLLRKLLLSKEFNVEPETELLLYTADRLEHQKKIILPFLNSGYAIISDRFLSSTYAYQVFGRGLHRQLLDLLKDISVFIYPDLTVILDIDPTIALERAKDRLSRQNMMELEGKFESLNVDFYKKVREGFFWYRDNFKNVVILNGNRRETEVFDAIKGYLGRFLDGIWV